MEASKRDKNTLEKLQVITMNTVLCNCIFLCQKSGMSKIHSSNTPDKQLTNP